MRKARKSHLVSEDQSQPDEHALLRVPRWAQVAGIAGGVALALTRAGGVAYAAADHPSGSDGLIWGIGGGTGPDNLQVMPPTIGLDTDGQLWVTVTPQDQTAAPIAKAADPLTVRPQVLDDGKQKDPPKHEDEKKPPEPPKHDDKKDDGGKPADNHNANQAAAHPADDHKADQPADNHKADQPAAHPAAITQQSAADCPPDQPAATNPAPAKPEEVKAATVKPAPQPQPATVKPATAKPATAQTVKPATVKPAADQSATVKPSTAKPATAQTVKPATVKPAKNETPTAKPATAQTANSQATEIKPATTKTANGQAATGKTASGKSANTAASANSAQASGATTTNGAQTAASANSAVSANAAASAPAGGTTGATNVQASMQMPEAVPNVQASMQMPEAVPEEQAQLIANVLGGGLTPGEVQAMVPAELLRAVEARGMTPEQFAGATGIPTSVLGEQTSPQASEVGPGMTAVLGEQTSPSAPLAAQQPAGAESPTMVEGVETGPATTGTSILPQLLPSAGDLPLPGAALGGLSMTLLGAGVALRRILRR